MDSNITRKIRIIFKKLKKFCGIANIVKIAQSGCKAFVFASVFAITMYGQDD